MMDMPEARQRFRTLIARPQGEIRLANTLPRCASNRITSTAHRNDPASLAV